LFIYAKIVATKPVVVRPWIWLMLARAASLGFSAEPEGERGGPGEFNTSPAKRAAKTYIIYRRIAARSGG
jgi:hypothetical protein